jgi:hypothetical protein
LRFRRQLITSLLLIFLLFAFAFSGIMHTHPGKHSTVPQKPFPAIVTDPEEQEFQEYVDALFTTSSTSDDIDTTGWCTHKINCNPFDFRFMYDTLKIPLIDSALKRNFTYPLKNYVTSPFGARWGYWHSGTDIKVHYRDTIRAVFDGIVRVIQNDRSGYGRVIVIRHRYGLESLYGHLSKCLIKKPNTEVKSGDPIGLGGRTGRATGRHLHFEIRFCGEPFDPASILDYENYTLKTDTLTLTRHSFNYLFDLQKTVFHTVRKGDNLGKIARKYGTSIRTLCKLNGITRKSIIRIGKKIMVRKMPVDETVVEKQDSGLQGG